MICLLNLYNVLAVPKIKRQRQQGTLIDVCVYVSIYSHIKMYKAKVKGFTFHVSEH